MAVMECYLLRASYACYLRRASCACYLLRASSACYLLRVSCTLLVAPATYSVLVAPCLLRSGLVATRIRLCPVLRRHISANRFRVLAKFSWSHCSYPESLMRTEHTRLSLLFQMPWICELRLLWQIPRKLACRCLNQGSSLLNSPHLHSSERDQSVQSFLKCHHFGQPEVFTN